MPRRRQRLQQEHPQVGHKIPRYAIVRIVEQYFHKQSLPQRSVKPLRSPGELARGKRVKPRRAPRGRSPTVLRGQSRAESSLSFFARRPGGYVEELQCQDDVQLVLRKGARRATLRNQGAAVR